MKFDKNSNVMFPNNNCFVLIEPINLQNHNETFISLIKNKNDFGIYFKLIFYLEKICMKLL